MGEYFVTLDQSQEKTIQTERHTMRLYILYQRSDEFVFERCSEDCHIQNSPSSPRIDKP